MNLPETNAAEMQRIHDESMRFIGVSVNRNNSMLPNLTAPRFYSQATKEAGDRQGFEQFDYTERS